MIHQKYFPRTIAIFQLPMQTSASAVYGPVSSALPRRPCMSIAPQNRASANVVQFVRLAQWLPPDCHEPAAARPAPASSTPKPPSLPKNAPWAVGSVIFHRRLETGIEFGCHAGVRRAVAGMHTEPLNGPCQRWHQAAARGLILKLRPS